MKCRFLILSCCLFWACSVYAVEPTQKEMATAKKWFNTTFDGETAPFSFVYGGKSSAELLPSWEKKTETKKLDDKRIEQTITWKDPATGLQVVLKGIRFTDFPTAEWTVSFTNTGKADTPILEKVLSGRFRFESRRKIARVSVALFGRGQLRTARLRAGGKNARPGNDTNFCAQRRTSDQWGLALL